jgi:hypothetical protein
MPSLKPGFTLEQHEQLGIELQKMRDIFPKQIVKLSKAYPQRTGVVDLAYRALEAIEMPRTKMDDLVCQEHPESESKNVLNIYYRKGREERLDRD